MSPLETKTSKVNYLPPADYHISCEDNRSTHHTNTNEPASSKRSCSDRLFSPDSFVPNNEEIIEHSANDHLPTILGNYHQGSAIYRVKGKQCTAACCMAAAFSKIKNVLKWEVTDMDSVLQEGTELYCQLRNPDIDYQPEYDGQLANYLDVQELPRTCQVFNKNFGVNMKSPVAAAMFSTSEEEHSWDLLPVNDALSIIFDTSDFCFVTLIDYTMMIGKCGNTFFVYDSHSRDNLGMLTQNGNSVLLNFKDLSSVSDHLGQWLVSMNHVSFTQLELIGMDMNILDDNDVTITPQTMRNIITFNPLVGEQQANACRPFKLSVQKPIQYGNGNNLARSFKTQKVTGDGNCFFRAISFVLTGTEEHHSVVRKVLVNHILKHPLRFKTWIRKEFDNVEQYIAASMMSNEDTWATELEIIALTDLLHIDVFTYHNSWLKYPPRGFDIYPQSASNAIYLHHRQGIHYDVVISPCNNLQNNEPITALEDSCISNPDESTEKRQLRNCKGKTITYVKKHRADKIKVGVNRKVYQANHMLQKYKANNAHRNREQKRSVQRYINDENHRSTVKNKSTNKYKNDEKHRSAVKKYSTNKYKNDEKHRSTVKNKSTNKYKNDEKHRNAVKKYSREKCKTNLQYRRKLLKQNHLKYTDNLTFRQQKIIAGRQRYARNNVYRRKLILATTAKYLRKRGIQRKSIESRKKILIIQALEKSLNSDYMEVLNKFRKEMEHGPEYACSCCERIFFANQVKKCNLDTYIEKGTDIADVADRCISNKYVHACTKACGNSCPYIGMPCSKQWICTTCHNKILKGQMPAESHFNNMSLEDIPQELSCLNSLERHLIAPIIPFFKMLSLPKGGQQGVKGPVVCVPSDILKTTTTLPRQETTTSLLRVKLKRKLCYEGYYEYEQVNPEHLFKALSFLKQENKFFSDITIDESWNEKSDENNDNEHVDVEECLEDDNDSEDERVAQNSAFPSETCLQPDDLEQFVLDNTAENIINLAPAEGE